MADEVYDYEFHESEAAHKGVARPDMRELGTTGSTIYGGMILPEYNSELRGPQGVRVYDRMRRGDAQVRATLRLIKAPVISAQWYVEAASEDQEDLDAAEFIEWNLHSMHSPFVRYLWEAMLSLDFGYYLFEKVFEEHEWTPERKGAHSRPVVKWKKWGPLHPFHVVDFTYDRHGEVNGVKFTAMKPDGSQNEVTIEFNKLLHFITDQEAGDPYGMSVLRSAYKHWYYKDNLYKVDAIQKERHGIGIPSVTLPPGFTEDDKRAANEMAGNLRTNEKAFVTKPAGWEVEFIKLEGQPVDVLKSAEHHDLMIARNVLVQFINLGSSQSGSRALGSAQIDIFTKAMRFMADLIRMPVNQYAIPQLVDYNFKVKRYPQLRVRRIGENADWSKLAVALRNLAEPGIITPNDETEQWLRDQMDFPSLATEDFRTTETRLSKGKGTRGGEPGANPTNA